MKPHLSLLAAALAIAGVLGASETDTWTVDSVAELLSGHGDGVAVTTDGRLVRAPRWQVGVVFDEPVALAGALAADGSAFVGTGHPARLYRVRGDRREMLAELPEEQVTAIAVEPDGSVLIAAASPGVLYRWAAGKLTEVGRLADGAIWDFVRFQGVTVAAAGTPATLYRVTSRGLERWLELPDVHARCLAVSGDVLVVGTSGKGLIVGVHADGGLSLLADSPFTEIASLAVGRDGSIWAAALVGEPGGAPTPAPSASSAADDTGSGSVSVSTSKESTTLNLPKVGGQTATSELLRLTPEGALLRAHRFTSQVATAAASDDDGILVGTGYEGEIWRFVDGGGARLAAVDAVQVVRLLGDGAAALAQGPAEVLWRQPPAEEKAARFRSAPKTFQVPVRLGRYTVSPPAGVRIRFRSAASEGPEESWLPWTEWLPAEGRVPLPAERSLQWEVELGAGATVERVEVATRQVNLAPVLSDVEVEEPGVVYLGAPPPSGPVLDAANPDVNGIFTVLDESASTDSRPKQGKKYWRVGYRTVSWKAEDANGDAMRFAVRLERADGVTLPVRERIDATQLALDTSAVPDGSYRFDIEATDEPSNPADPRTAEATSPWFRVDSTPPRVTLERSGAEWVVTADDGPGSLARAEWSRDGQHWRALEPQDGLLDGPKESFRIPAASGRHLVVVRVVDRHHNRTVVGGEEY